MSNLANEPTPGSPTVQATGEAHRIPIPAEQGHLLLEMCKYVRRLRSRRDRGAMTSTPTEFEWLANLADSQVVNDVIALGERMGELGPRTAVNCLRSDIQFSQIEQTGSVDGCLVGPLLMEAITQAFADKREEFKAFLATVDPRRIPVSLLIAGREFPLPAVVSRWEASIDDLAATRAKQLIRDKVQETTDIIDQIGRHALERLNQATAGQSTDPIKQA